MRLVLVPTPIGNLEDITLRALQVLREAEVVACEDTRHTGNLLKHFGIETPTTRLDQHTLQRAKGLLEKYQYVAYASDAGTPGISDPGAELVKLAIALGWQVEVLPGPTAFVPALVASGFPTARFVFEGFLPQKPKERRERIQSLFESGRTVVIYESPHRLKETLLAFSSVFGETHPVAIAREISKMHQEIFRGSLAEALAHFTGPRGEFVLVLAPAAMNGEGSGLNAESLKLNADELVLVLRSRGLGGRELVKALVEAGVPRNQAYQLAHGRKETQ